MPNITGFVDKLVEWKEVLIPLAAGITAIVAAIQIWNVVTAIARGITAAFAAVQAVLNVVLSANPIGLIVLAIVGLVPRSRGLPTVGDIPKHRRRRVRGHS